MCWMDGWREGGREDELIGGGRSAGVSVWLCACESVTSGFREIRFGMR